MLAVVAAFYAVMVPYRVEQKGILWFPHFGAQFLHRAHTSPRIDSLHRIESPAGYDGQFYFFIAADPVHAKDYTDQVGVRYARIVYPGLSWLLSGGGRLAALPWVMLALNLIAVGGGTWAVALWLRRRARSPWFALLYGLWPGLIFCVFRDLSEPIAYCLLALAMLAFDRWILASAGLLGLSLLTRETTIAFAVAIALALALRDRRRAAGFLAVALLPMIVWRAIITLTLHSSTIESSGAGIKSAFPFYSLYARWPFDWQHWVLFWSVYVPLLVVGAGALWLLYRRRHVTLALVAVLNVALFVVWMPRNVTIDWGADVRNVIPALMAALYLVPVVRSRVALATGFAFFSPLWYLLLMAAYGQPGLHFMTV